jgi:hypothetical protein
LNDSFSCATTVQRPAAVSVLEVLELPDEAGAGAGLPATAVPEEALAPPPPPQAAINTEIEAKTRREAFFKTFARKLEYGRPLRAG